MRTPLLLSTLALGLALAACGGDSSDSGTGGAPVTGGAASGGRATGGNRTGGAPGTGGATGGTSATGGSATGGGATGGAASGGTGGARTGGSPGTGGSATGGASGGNGGGRGGLPATGGNPGGGPGGSGTGGNGTGGAQGGSTGKASVCTFSSGLNIAWVNFAGDVPNPDLKTFDTIFANTYKAGGRTVRWWFHTNGSVTPGYDSSGKAKKLPQAHIDGVKAILKSAHDAGIGLVISLWSFDMLQSNAGDAHTNNALLLENDDNRQAYIDNYLTPLVTALKGTPGLYAYEIFNEPEGMGPSGWATYRTTLAAIQKCVNWFTAAIRAADPNVLVTTSAVTFDYCSNGISGKQNLYSDTALRNVGGKQNGTLDFYQVHYYTSNGVSNSAFKNPASHWGLTDKKLVMGEFAAQDTEGVLKDDLYKNLQTNGYSGAWAWSYDADWTWPAMEKGMQSLYDAQKTLVDACKP